MNALVRNWYFMLESMTMVMHPRENTVCHISQAKKSDSVLPNKLFASEEDLKEEAQMLQLILKCKITKIMLVMSLKHTKHTAQPCTIELQRTRISTFFADL